MRDILEEMNGGIAGASLLACALLACEGEGKRASVVLEPRDECYQRADRLLCSGNSALRCVDGKVDSREECVAPRTCIDRQGCGVCAAGRVSCDGNARMRCSADGNTLTREETCNAPLSCSALGCVDLCAEAASNRSYLGCDYWPVFTSNSQLDALFNPAVAVGNGNLVSAHVVISKAGAVVAELDVPPHDARTVELRFEDALKNAGGTRLVRQGAYHLTSSVPVTVHQFNPLHFELPRACTVKEGERPPVTEVCNSYTNDASLLFPSTALRRDPDQPDSQVLRFLAASRASFMQANTTAEGVVVPGFGGTPGFVAIVAVGNTPARVTLRSTAFTMPSPTEVVEDSLEALAPGATLERNLMPGDVLQVLTQVPSECPGLLSDNLLYCDPGRAFDLTGTEISADAPIQVISGHDCSNVPFEVAACDHLEESLVPLHAWGTRLIVAVPARAAGDASVLRVLSAVDNNTVRFDPPIHEPVVLARGELLELTATESSMVSGTGRLMVAQYLLGQRQAGRVGDPSLTIAVPIDQYRTHYNFVSPESYALNYVDIVALASDVVTLDGELVSNFVKLGETNFAVATVELTTSGAHELRGDSGTGLGIVLYGLGSFTSYMLPAGLDLQPLGPIGI